MNIKLKTNEQLSATVANGLAGVFINGVSLSASLSGASGKVYFDNRISSVTGSNDLSIVKLSADEYAQMLDGGTCLSNAIYIVEAPNIDAFKQRITNVAPGTLSSDAVNVDQLCTAISAKSTVSFNRIATTGTNIGNITIDGNTTQIYAPSSGGGGGGISRYALVNAYLQSAGQSLSCAIQDQTITTIQITSDATPIIVQLPEAPEDGARDFILRIEISSATAPTFTFNGVGETIDFDSEDDDWAVLEPGLNLVSFTETKRNG